MYAIRLLCVLLLICGQGCQRGITSSAQDKDRQCEKLVDQMISTERDFIAALHSIQDLETAKNSAERIRKDADKFDTISKEFERLWPLSPQLRARLIKKLEMEDGRGLSTITNENVRVATPEEAKIIDSAAEIFFEKWESLTTKAGLLAPAVGATR